MAKAIHFLIFEQEEKKSRKMLEGNILQVPVVLSKMD